MRSFVDFDYVNIALLPLFLFSATFFPLSQYPTAVQWIVRATPLYQGVALERALAFGEFSWAILVHVVYLAAMGLDRAAASRAAGSPCCSSRDIAMLTHERTRSGSPR